MSRHYIIFHLFNDFSGSPKVLKIAIGQMLDAGDTVTLYTSRGGPLDSMNHPNLHVHHIPYTFSHWKAVTCVRYSFAQIISFVVALRYAFKKNIHFYINTILPIGATLGAKLSGKPVTLHCHEVPGAKGLVYDTLINLQSRMADNVICVSKYQSDLLKNCRKKTISQNLLSEGFKEKVNPDPIEAFERKTVLMLSSLKEYKGIPQFISIAGQMPEYKFTLVINDSQTAIEDWFNRNKLNPGSNVRIYSRQTNVARFYNESSIVLNLSDPAVFVETFGMTALEARACRLPLIVPTIGGIAEQVSNGINGYHINCNDTDKICEAIRNLLTDRNLYIRIAEGTDHGSFI